MMQQRVFKSMLLAVAASTVLMAGAYASRTSYHRIHLPGVDHFGNLSNRCGNKCRVKLVCDTRHHRFCATGHGYVKNRTHRKQVYRNRMSVSMRPLAAKYGIPYHSIKPTRDVYTVYRGKPWHHHRAKCKAICCGRIEQRGGYGGGGFGGGGA